MNTWNVRGHQAGAASRFPRPRAAVERENFTVDSANRPSLRIEGVLPREVPGIDYGALQELNVILSPKSEDEDADERGTQGPGVQKEQRTWREPAYGGVVIDRDPFGRYDPLAVLEAQVERFATVKSDLGFQAARVRRGLRSPFFKA